MEMKSLSWLILVIIAAIAKANEIKVTEKGNIFNYLEYYLFSLK